MVDGRLTSDDPLVRKSLATAIFRAFDEKRRSMQLPVLLPRNCGKTALVAQMSPLVAVYPAGALPMKPGTALGVLVVLDPAEHLEIDAEIVARWFGLSPSEGRVAAEIARGRTPRDAAESLLA